MATATRPRFSVTAVNRPLNNWEESPQCWEDHRDPECYFRAQADVDGGFVKAEFRIVHDSDTGMIWLYAEDNDTRASDEGRPMIELHPLEIDFHPTELPKLAKLLHALADAISAIDRAASEQLPALRQEGREFAEMFERLAVARGDSDDE